MPDPPSPRYLSAVSRKETGTKAHLGKDNKDLVPRDSNIIITTRDNFTNLSMEPSPITQPFSDLVQLLDQPISSSRSGITTIGPESGSVDWISASFHFSFETVVDGGDSRD